MNIYIRRALAASSAIVAATGVALAAPAAASATPAIAYDGQGVVMTFNDLDERAEDLAEQVVDAIDDFAPHDPEVEFVNLRGSRSAIAWNHRPLHLAECTQAESLDPMIRCWSILDD